ncbi:MAG: tetratricopeptide repeat protein [Acidobacteria bacterium]|nr:tetratricopeptide repeat protein [Acidobacteriota bacterium]
MRGRAVAGPALIALAVLFSGPGVLAADPEVQDQLFKLQKDTARLLDKLEKLEQSQGDRSTAACAETVARMDALERQFRVLEEQLLAAQRQLDETLGEVRALRRSSAQPLAPAQQPAPAGAAQLPPTSPGPVVTAPAPAGGSPNDLFNAAYADYSRRHFDLALAGFESALRVDPDGPMADDAQYWIGETLYAMNRPLDAVQAFDRLISGFAGSDKVPAAHLKKGLALLDARRTTDGAQELQMLVKRWPESAEARIAQEHMKRRGLLPAEP